MLSLFSRLILFAFMLNGIGWHHCYAQYGFAYGQITVEELDMKKYDADTTATAVVLDEFGDAYFNLDNLNEIYFYYHVKIKILKEEGKKEANFIIPLRQYNGKRDLIKSIRASSFNRNGIRWKETQLQNKDIFEEKVDKDFANLKFAVPNVQVGSIIEVEYLMQTPYTFNFIPWTFQTNIPKRQSVFKAMYPAYYDYAITVRGSQQLNTNEGKVVKECIGSTSSHSGGGADCLLYVFGMNDIPAFKEEEYMTAPRNFKSAVRFELDKITQQDGRVNNITSDWKSLEAELDQHEFFGKQIRKSKAAWDEQLDEIFLSGKDSIGIAKGVFNYVKENFVWNEEHGCFGDVGVKKLLESKAGNIADINFMLLGGLLKSGIDAEPVLVSTRDHGLPTKLHAVISDFNYIIVQVKIKNQYFFLDASNKKHPFHFIPEVCLNGEGRVIGKSSHWIELKPTEKNRTTCNFEVSLAADGKLNGSAVIYYFGYSAFDMRQKISTNKNASSHNFNQEWLGLSITNHRIENFEDLDKPLIERFNVSLSSLVDESLIILPISLINRFPKNPFSLTERSYPVDFGPPIEFNDAIVLTVDQAYSIEDAPKSIGFGLPQNSGRCLLNVSNLNGKLVLSTTFSVNKSIYNPNEYASLKEYFNRYLVIQNSKIVVKRLVDKN